MPYRRRDDLPGFERARRLFRNFHEYRVGDVGRLSVRLPEEVAYMGPCTYVTYRSDKWNNGTYDYIHKIDSYPHVALGLVNPGKHVVRSWRKVPRRINDNATLVQIQKRALGFGYRDENGHEQNVEVKSCEWFWHPQGKALLLVRNKRLLLGIVWGGKLGFKPQGIVGR